MALKFQAVTFMFHSKKHGHATATWKEAPKNETYRWIVNIKTKHKAVTWNTRQAPTRTAAIRFIKMALNES